MANEIGENTFLKLPLKSAIAAMSATIALIFGTYNFVRHEVGMVEVRLREERKLEQSQFVTRLELTEKFSDLNDKMNTQVRRTDQQYYSLIQGLTELKLRLAR